MSKTILALVAAGILGAATIPTGAYAADLSTNRADIRQDKTTLHQDHRMIRHAIRTGHFYRAERLRHEVRMDRRDLHRDRAIRDMK